MRTTASWPGHGRLVAGNVIGHFRQRLRVDAGQRRRISGVSGELLEQLEVGEAQADRLDLGEHLMRSGLGDRLGRIERKLVRADQLDGALRCGISVMSSPHSRFRAVRAGDTSASSAAELRLLAPGCNSRPAASKKSFFAATDAKGCLRPGAEIAEPALALQNGMGIHDVGAPSGRLARAASTRSRSKESTNFCPGAFISVPAMTGKLRRRRARRHRRGSCSFWSLTPGV